MLNELQRGSNWLLAGLVIVISLTRADALQSMPGLVVEEVGADSLAAKAGLKVGDRILSYDGKALPSPAALQAAQQNTFGKREIVVRVRRGEETMALTIAIGGLGVQVHTELPPAALKLYQEGKAALQAQKSKEAIISWEEAAKVARLAGDKATAAWLYGRIGDLYESKRQWKEASASHLAAWEILKQSDDASAQSRSLTALGRCSRSLNDFSSAEKWFDQAKQTDLATNNGMWVAGDLNNLGSVAYSRGDLQAAQGYYSQALEITERLAPDSLNLATALNNLGSISASRGDLQAAQDYHSRALEIRERLAPDSLSVASSLNNLGSVASNLQAAQDYYSRALIIFERLAPDSLDVALSLSNLGSIYTSRGDLQAAQDYHSRALEIRHRLAPDSLNVATSLNNLGIVALYRGDLQAAQDYHSRALGIRQRLAPDSLSVAGSLNGLGNVATSRGDLQAAQGYYGRALEIRKRLAPDSLSVASSLNNLGIVALYRGDLQAAQDYHDRALVIFERLAPNSLSVAVSLNNLGGVALSRNDLRAAQGYLNRALTGFEQLAPNSLSVEECLTYLGHVALAERRFSDARSHFARAVAIVEAHRSEIPSTEGRALFLARHAESYSGLLRTHFALNDLPGAFAILERYRARSIVELLAERRLDFRTDAPASLLKQQDELDQNRSDAYSSLAKLDFGKDSKQIDQLRDELKKYEVQQRELESKIRRASPRFASLRYPEPLDLNRAQAALNAGTLLLTYYVDEEKSYLFAITKTGLKLFTLPVDAKTLEAEVSIFREQVARKRLGDPNERGKRLYDVLIRPVQGLVNQAERILICPDGPLQTLPFAALVKHTRPGLRYFIEEKPLHMIVSMTVYAETLKQAERNTKQEKRVLAFGDPIYTKEQTETLRGQKPVEAAGEHTIKQREETGADSYIDYARRRGFRLDNRLPHTLKEVEEIGRLFGKSTTIKLGEAATEASVKQESKDYKILHLAVHGWLDEQVGLNSGLALSQPELLGKKATKDDNGLLQAWEIFEQVRLNADLVTLSACDTALGQMLRGEGLIGLTRAIQYAGAKSIIVSLWGVSDESTAVLMTAFYKELSKGVSKDVALQKAMAIVRSNPRWQSPFFWSPFILVGSWN
jgi:CHAT domain-containing protein/Tfp pilus assembly protein PilF